MVDFKSQERRLSQRIEGAYCAKYRFYDPVNNQLQIHEHEAATLDISRTGVALVTEKRIDPGAQLLIKFSFKSNFQGSTANYKRVVVFMGTVVYAAPLKEHYFRIGIYFGPSNEGNDMKFIEVLSSPASHFESYPKRDTHATLHVGM